MPKKKPEHYVNNKELLEAMINYRSRVERSYKNTFGLDLTEQPKKERGKRWRRERRARGRRQATSIVATYKSFL